MSLYRKYRPKIWKELLGQNHIRITLQNELATGSVTHAYIFTGPRGIGKTTTARLLAKSITCENFREDKEPCNTCAACVEVQQGKAIDIVEIDAASHTGVDNVRENIIQNARVAPTRLKYKVFIIDEVHMLSASAFNALLKILEEPPKQVLFILATTEIHKVPETVISRCQRFDFRKVSTEHLVEILQDIAEKEGRTVEPEILKTVARRADGCIRDAQSLLEQILALEEKHVTSEVASLVLPRTDIESLMTLFETLVKEQTATALEHIQKLAEEGVNFLEFTKNMIEFLRQMLLIKVQGQTKTGAVFDLSSDQETRCTQLLVSVETQELLWMLELFIEKMQDMKRIDLFQLPLELAVVQITLGHHSQASPTRREEDKKTQPAVKTQENENSITKTILSDALQRVETQDQQTDGLENIKKQWKTIVRRAQQHNHSLALMLKVASLASLENDILTLGFRYQFYHDRISEEKHRQVIEKVASEVTGRKIMIRCEIGEKFDIQPPFKKADNFERVPKEEAKNVWDLALNTFGGDVVQKST